MGLFSFILDYAGGTYLDQVEADSPCEALILWAKAINPKVITELGKSGRGQLLEAAALSKTESDIVEVTGLVNVWCWTGRAQNKLALVHIVKTELGGKQ
jgi:hypothetical protein